MNAERQRALEPQQVVCAAQRVSPSRSQSHQIAASRACFEKTLKKEDAR